MNEINRLLNEMQEIHDRIVKINADFIHKIEMAKIRKKNALALQGIDFSPEGLKKLRAPTKEELFEQRVSYIFGQTNGI